VSFLLDPCVVGERDLVAGVEDRATPGAERDHDAWPIAGSDEAVRGAGRTVEVVPGTEPPLLALHDEQALALDDEEALLLRLAVVQHRRLAGLVDMDANADLGALRDEHRAVAELLVHPPLVVGDVADEPVRHAGSSSRRARSAARARRTTRSPRPRARRTVRHTPGTVGAPRRRTVGRWPAPRPRTPRTSGAPRRNRDRM